MKLRIRQPAKLEPVEEVYEVWLSGDSFSHEGGYTCLFIGKPGDKVGFLLASIDPFNKTVKTFSTPPVYGGFKSA